MNKKLKSHIELILKKLEYPSIEISVQTPRNMEHGDLTTNIAGIPITNLNHLWCWDYTIAWNSNMQAYYPICNSPTDLYTGSGQSYFNHVFDNIGINDVFVIVTNNIC